MVFMGSLKCKPLLRVLAPSDANTNNIRQLMSSREWLSHLIGLGKKISFVTFPYSLTSMKTSINLIVSFFANEISY